MIRSFPHRQDVTRQDRFIYYDANNQHFRKLPLPPSWKLTTYFASEIIKLDHS